MAVSNAAYGAGGTVGAFKGISAGLRFGSDLTSAYSHQLMASGALIGGRLSRWNYGNVAEGYAADAQGYAAQAGDFQQAGMDRAFIRYWQLGHDIGRIRSKAAGSGIDMSSDIVSRVEGQSRRNAVYDVRQIQRTANANAAGAMDMARSSMVSSAYAKAQGEIEMAGAEATAAANRASASAARNMAWANLIGGIGNSIGGGFMAGAAIA